MAVAKSHVLLARYWEEKKKKTPRFSLRALAKKLEISPAFLSKILSGQKPLPLVRVSAIARALDLDPVAARALERACLREQALSEETRENLEVDLERQGFASLSPLPSEKYEVTPDLSPLDEWYYLPILDLVTCEGFEPAWISDRLGLKNEVAQKAWQRLIAQGWVEQRDGVWQKAQKKIRFPASRVNRIIQKHHTMMLKKAADELARKNTEADFKRRLIVGASMATNEESYRKAEKFIEEALYKATDILSSGKGDRVYYLAVQLFPLLK